MTRLLGTNDQYGLGTQHSYPLPEGQEIPSLRMRNWRLERFIPRRAAAPWGPATTQFACSRALRISCRSASSSTLRRLTRPPAPAACDCPVTGLLPSRSAPSASASLSGFSAFLVSVILPLS